MRFITYWPIRMGCLQLPPTGEKKQCMMTRAGLGLVFVISVLLSVVVLYCVHPPTINSSNNGKEGGVSPTAPAKGADESAQSDPLLVNTQYGWVRGTKSGQVKVFRGIPYAKAPVGKLRWRHPRDPLPWSPAVFDGTKIRPGCPQECISPLYCSNSTSEDCLFVDIYVPSTDISNLVPVMVYCHGGSFKDVTITLPIYDATVLAQRSGALGFLYTGKGGDQATGNYGILDQRQALRWITANIKSFGGDPDQVTIAGQSSGSQSVLTHLDSDESRFFRSIIVESTPLTLPYRSAKTARVQGWTFAKILNCVSNNTAVNLTCLREIPTQMIVDAQRKSTESDMSIVSKIEPWAPVIDGHSIKSQPLDALREYAETNKEIKPIICGYTTEEGLGFVKGILLSPLPYAMYKFTIPIVLNTVPENMDQLYPITDISDTREVLSQILTDLVFRCPLRHFLKLLKKFGHIKNTWLYAWDRSPDATLPPYFQMCQNRTCHNSEIPFVFQSFSQIFSSVSHEDLQLSNILIDYYTHFIKSGNPNRDKNTISNESHIYSDLPATSEGAPLLKHWSPALAVDNNDIKQLIFTRNADLKIDMNKNDQRCDAWDKVGYSVLGGSK